MIWELILVIKVGIKEPMILLFSDQLSSKPGFLTSNKTNVSL